MLWIDDLQWGDLDSTALLRELLRPPDAPTMLLLLSYRSEDRGHVPFLTALEEYAEHLPTELTHVIPLAPLDATESRALTRLLSAERCVADEYVDAIAAESRGSPFFVGQLVDRFASTRSVAGSGQTALSLAAVLGDRVQHLSAPARQLLEVIAVAAGPLDRRVALQAAGVGEQRRLVIASLEQGHLLRSTTLNDQPAVEVYHDRIREALVAGLSVEDLRARHRALTDVLERQPSPDPEALFRHLLGAGDGEQAAYWAAHAADRAAAALAFAHAADLYGRALDLHTDDDAHTGTWQVQRANALVNAGRRRRGGTPLYRRSH